MDEIYNNYLQDDTRIKIIDGTVYTKIIYKDILPVRNGMVEIVLPTGIFNCVNSKMVVDEKGREFSLTGPVTMSFCNELPRWYRETVIYTVDGISDSNAVGDYVRAVG